MSRHYFDEIVASTGVFGGLPWKSGLLTSRGNWHLHCLDLPLMHESLYPRQNGFTILELLIAILIMFVMLAFALPKMSAAVAAHRVIAGVRTTASHVRLVRATAIGRNAPARLGLIQGGTVLTVQVLKNGTWSTVGSEMPLDRGVVVTTVPNPVVFQPHGAAESSATITVTGENGAGREIGVSILGSVEIH
jgi:prepilin-type N-terminal cleavage/methylation domain-containing protein